jgi:hypothetical protein
MLRNTSKHHFGSNGVEWMPHNFGTPKQCIQSPNTSFASFYLSKVCENLRNTHKHHFGWNGVEWMFTTLASRNCLFRPETQILHLFTCRRLAKFSQTLPNIIWVQCSRMDTSQLRYPETEYSVLKHNFCIFLPVEGLRNALKHSQTPFWVKWSRMDASQLRHSETVYSGPKHKFCIFLPVEG